MKKALILHLEAPMQSWGIDSRYRLRRAGEAPSKSALCGLACAAMGSDRQSEAEKQVIAQFSSLRMVTYGFSPAQRHTELLRDYHTVQGTRNTEGKFLKNAILTDRYYHQDKRFAVLLESDAIAFLEQLHHAIQHPVWGIWLGRKCCIPAAPLIQEDLLTPDEAREILLKTYPRTKWNWEIFEEVEHVSHETSTWLDQPVSFGRADSSGRDGREWKPRLVRHHALEPEGDEFFQGF